MSIPKGINREDVLRALDALDRGEQHDFGKPKRYNLVYQGKRYPPKAVIGLASQRLLGRTLTHIEFKSGEVEVNRILRTLGFEVVNKGTIKDSIEEPTENRSYSIDQAASELFISREMFEEITLTIERKKNIILQGPPGVGKSFVAKKLAHFLTQSSAPSKVQMVQFHQSYSYEDFIQGWRPNEKGGFSLSNGIFYRFCGLARHDSNGKYVFIIDEINRGNVSKILGELMLLIECDKRGDAFAIPLTYTQENEPPFYVPENIYLIGLMNTADRSLAMVDYALRRRFVFFDLEPKYQSDKFQSLLQNMGISDDIIQRIVDRMSALNNLICEDHKNLGRGFAIGHSFFCPPTSRIDDQESWYTSIVKNELGPLLREYYFDNPDKAETLISNLL